jgi:hypothetical protein
MNAISDSANTAVALLSENGTKSGVAPNVCVCREEADRTVTARASTKIPRREKVTACFTKQTLNTERVFVTSK